MINSKSQYRNIVWALCSAPLIALFACSADKTEAVQQPRQAAETTLSEAGSQQPNILFIAIDDLRPEINALGAQHIKTPHLDSLVNNGRAFSHHYVHVPSCGPSRFALLTGMIPQTTGHTESNAVIRDEISTTGAQYESFAHAFRENGYKTVAIGKISHYVDGRIWEYDGSGDGRPEMPKSWDEQSAVIDEWETAWNGFFAYAGGRARGVIGRDKALPTEAAEGPDTIYPDGRTTLRSIEALTALKQDEEPFFLAVGYYKPHLPFNAPKHYWDLYDRQSIELAPHQTPPENVAALNTLHNSFELRAGYGGAKKMPDLDEPIDEEIAREWVHGYYASVSYVDAQIGKLMAALDDLGLSDNTIVVLWSDHGWHLGDLGVWGKHTLYDYSLLSPLIFSMPGIENPGAVSDAIVETVDVYPTLLDLADIDIPDGLSGTSLRPQLEDPSLPSGRPARGFWKDFVTVRSQSHRVIVNGDGETEIYNYIDDPKETRNIADAETMLLVRDELALANAIRVENTTP